MRHDTETRHLLQEMGISHDQLDAKLDRIEGKPEISGRTSATAEDSSSRARQRVEAARGKDAIPQPKSGDLFAKLGETTEDEGTKFNPNDFSAESPVKLTPLSERGRKSILSVKVDGERAGQISMTRMPELGKNAAEMSTAQLKEEFRGKGLGKYSYESALDYAKDKGYDTVYSDDQVSDAAKNVWKSLERQGKASWDGKLKRYKVKL
jgi:predicted GNAT family acetyltransferase